VVGGLQLVPPRGVCFVACVCVCLDWLAGWLAVGWLVGGLLDPTEPLFNFLELVLHVLLGRHFARNWSTF
jgi:hypothetical protein